MKCKYCGTEFKFRANKLFCSSLCYKKFHKPKHRCSVCGKTFQGMQGGKKYCSKECYDAKRRDDYAAKKQKLKKENLKEQSKKVKQSVIYLKDFNSNIEVCLNCTKDVCYGECEKINPYIRG